MIRFFTTLIGILVFQVCLSQTIDKRWNIGVHGGAVQYYGDLGNDFYKADQAFYGFGGISVSRYLVKPLDLSLFISRGETGFHNAEGRFQTGFSTATLNLRLNILDPLYMVRPYLFVGGGAILYEDEPTEKKKNQIDYAAPSFGAGFNVSLGETVSLQIQEMVLYSTGDKIDGVEGDRNDAFLLHTAGLTFNLGSKKDQDKDEIADRLDKCPDTPPGVSVDKNGCPLDRDNDKVADYLDDCPDEAGVQNFKGCPDSDGDGLRDKDDKCPNVKGLLELRGCADTDEDGVADPDDKCADTPKNYKADATGCPMDNDKDGLMNEDDACPDQVGITALKGCPDSDEDGVADNEDRCPAIKGTVANKGCPEMTREDIRKITQIASKIFFEFNSDKLKTASLVQLDDLVDILKKYPAANLYIEGHTDNVGDDEYNQTLSQKRTESVKRYLSSKGIEESRLNAVGYGETRPIADNKSSLGRSKNRRVELRTSY